MNQIAKFMLMLNCYIKRCLRPLEKKKQSRSNQQAETNQQSEINTQLGNNPQIEDSQQPTTNKQDPDNPKYDKPPEWPLHVLPAKKQEI
jgi:hypothetical protein